MGEALSVLIASLGPARDALRKVFHAVFEVSIREEVGANN